MGLSVGRCTAESAAIEDIPSSMQPEGTHHERHPASPCNCTPCPGTGCTCGCQQAAEQTAGACGRNAHAARNASAARSANAAPAPAAPNPEPGCIGRDAGGRHMAAAAPDLAGRARPASTRRSLSVNNFVLAYVGASSAPS